MPGFNDFIGRAGSAGTQLFVWQVLGQIISSLGTPYAQALTQAALAEDPNTPMSPADAAESVARAIMDPETAHTIGKKSGVAPAVMDDLVKVGQHAAQLATAADLYRRGIIPLGEAGVRGITFHGALVDTGVRPEWATIMEQSLIQIPSVAEVMNAWLEGQITEAEANRRYLQAGGDPTWFQTSYNANGQAPTPDEALVLVNRGIIPESGTGPDSISYEQAFLEGPWRNKWLKPFRALGVYLPPPRTVTAMFKEGSLDKNTAITLLQKQGLSAELAAAYVASGDSQASADDKKLTQASIISMYEARILGETDTQTMLEALGYSPDNASYLVQLADLRRSISAVNTAVARVHTLYTGHKITRKTAQDTLVALQVPADQITEILHIWDLEEAVNVRQLTEAQIVDAWANGIITQDAAIGELTVIGYTSHDAWILLSNKNKQALPGEPPTGPNPIGTLP